jgi:hypothetical protein
VLTSVVILSPRWDGRGGALKTCCFVLLSHSLAERKEKSVRQQVLSASGTLMARRCSDRARRHSKSPP